MTSEAYRQRRRLNRSLGLIADRLAVNDGSSRGSLSRLGTIRHAVRRFDAVAVGPGVVLIDQNVGKLNSIKELLNLEPQYLNPVRTPLLLRDRVQLLFSSFLPSRSREVHLSVVLSRAVIRLLPPETTAFLWNPYSLVQFAITMMANTADAFLLAPNYPAPLSCRRIYCNRTVREIHRIPFSQWRDSTPQLCYLADTSVIRIYPTRLDRVPQREAEIALLAFAQSIHSNLEYPVEIFLHYSDHQDAFSKLDKMGLLEGLGHLIKPGKSLNNLSKNQISFSATSTIGFDLFSGGMSHIFVSGESTERHVPGPEVNDWLSRTPFVVQASDHWTLWVKTMQEVFPVLARRLNGLQ